MSKQATPPPPGDKAKPTAPPPPPTWRNWLWPVMIFVIFALFFLLPTRSPSTNLTYSQFLSDVSNHQVKTVQLAGTTGGTSTGTLTNGKSFTVVIPPQAGPDLLTTLQTDGVQISSAPSGNGFGLSPGGGGVACLLMAAPCVAQYARYPGRDDQRAAYSAIGQHTDGQRSASAKE